MDEILKYVQSSFNMAALDVDNLELNPKMCGRLSILKRGKYNIYVSNINIAPM